MISVEEWMDLMTFLGLILVCEFIQCSAHSQDYLTTEDCQRFLIIYFHKSHVHQAICSVIPPMYTGQDEKSIDQTSEWKCL